MRGRLDRRHNETPHPGALPFGREEGESSSGFGVAHAADYSVYSRAIADLGKMPCAIFSSPSAPGFVFGLGGAFLAHGEAVFAIEFKTIKQPAGLLG